VYNRSKKKSPLSANKGKRDALCKWEVLSGLIKSHVEAQIADHEKGGGDPSSYHEIELEARLAKLMLDRHIEQMRNDFQDYGQ
jgi:hypothetical protein